MQKEKLPPTRRLQVVSGASRGIKAKKAGLLREKNHRSQIPQIENFRFP
jgi:hypothetical protein